MSLRDLITGLLGTKGAGERFPEPVEALIPELIDMVVEEVDPRLKTLPGFARKVEPPIRRTIAYLRELALRLPQEPLELTAAAWSGTPQLNAIFAAAEDIDTVVNRSDDLRKYFAANAGARDAYAWLGVERRERNVLGVEISGETVRRDVPQVTVSFAEPRLVFAATTVAGARIELGMAIIRGMLGIAMGRIEDLQGRAKSLEETRAMLKSRLRRLKGTNGGITALGDSTAAHAAEMDRIEKELAQLTKDMYESKAKASDLDTYLDEVRTVLDEPEKLLTVETVAVRVNKLGIQVGPDFAGPVNEFSVNEICAPKLRRAAFLVHCYRRG
jgi:hypothetical protein